MERRTIVSVIGDAASFYGDASPYNKKKWDLAYELGTKLVDNGFRVMTGGGRGVMRAVMAGAHASAKYRDGDTIAILPSYDQNTANDFADICIATGLDFYRDTIIANSEVVVAVGGGSGTLNELSAAWKLGRLSIAYNNVNGWSAKLADTQVDDKSVYDFEQKIFGVENADQVIEIIKEWLPKYNKCFDRIPFGIPCLVPKQKSNWVGPIITDKVKKI